MTALQSLSKANSTIGTNLVKGAGRLASTAFLNLGSWRDDDVQRYINQISPGLTGIKQQAANSTIAFYRAMSGLNDTPFKNPILNASDLSTKALRNGVGEEIVYGRPFVDMRTALSQGKSVKDAIEAGARRAAYLASTEVQLARRNAGFVARNNNDTIVGYARILTGSENCALCFVASTQRYRRGDLMPIHPGCDCGEMPIYGDQDPGQVINELRLDAVHQNVQERFGISDASARAIDYRKIKIVDHGEMGPLLTVRGQSAEIAGDVGNLFGNSRVLGEYSDAEKSALRDYTSQNYTPINSGLRYGFDRNTNRFINAYSVEQIDAARQTIPLLDAAFEKSFIADDLIVYRGARIPEIRNLDKAQLVGMKITDKGFVSTTSWDFDSFNTLNDFGSTQNEAFEITLKKGSRGIDLKGNSVTQFELENEILLPRDSVFTITDVIEKEYNFRGQTMTRRVIKMEVSDVN